MNLKDLIAKQRAQTNVASTPAEAPKPKTTGLPKGLPINSKPQAPAIRAPEAEPVDSLSLEGLASVDMSSMGSSEPDASESPFADYIEATKPERKLPEDLLPQQLGFVALLDSIYDILTEPELFAQSIRSIMSELSSFPEYDQLIADEDVHTIIRGMRNTMGLAKIRKQEKSRKPSTRKASGAKLLADAFSSEDLIG